MQLLEQYATRPVRPLGLFEHAGWRLKAVARRAQSEPTDRTRTPAP
jgi:hypothetical protein